jgi:hypothetical protein
MGDVASLATHVQRRVPAALVGHVESLLMAGEAQVFVRAARRWLQQLVLVIGRMRIVTLEAIADRGRMNRSLQFGCILVGVAGKTERVGRCGDQLDTSDVFRHPHFVATGATGRDGRVDCLTLGFVLMTFNALCGVRVRGQRYGVCSCAAKAGTQNQAQSQKQPYCSHEVPPPENYYLCTSITVSSPNRLDFALTRLTC